MNVVVFSEEARVLLTNTTTLVRANTENTEELVGLVQNLEVRCGVRSSVARVRYLSCLANVRTTRAPSVRFGGFETYSSLVGSVRPLS